MMQKVLAIAVLLVLAAAQASAQAPSSIDRTRSGTGPWTGKHNNLPKQVVSPAGGVFTPPSSFGNWWLTTSAASQTIACPLDIADGDSMDIHIQQGASAPFSPNISFNTPCYGWSTGVQPTWSTTGATVDWVFCQSMNPPDVTGASFVCTPQLAVSPPPFFSFVNAVGCPSASGATCTTSAVSMTGANLLVMAVSIYTGGGASITNPTDSSGNTYTQALTITETTGNMITKCYYSFAPTVTGSMTFSATISGSGFPGISAAGFSGAIASPLDVTSSATSGASQVNSQAPGSITPTNSNELAVACLGLNGNPSSGLSIDSGYSLVGAVNEGSGTSNQNVGSALGWKVVSVATNPTFSWTGTNFASAGIMSFK